MVKGYKGAWVVNGVGRVVKDIWSFGDVAPWLAVSVAVQDPCRFLDYHFMSKRASKLMFDRGFKNRGPRERKDKRIIAN